MKKYLVSLTCLLIICGIVNAQKNDFSIGAGITTPFILEDASSDLTFDMASTIGITEKFGIVINSDYNFYKDDWSGGKYKFLNCAAGARFKFVGEHAFSTYGLKAGITFSTVPSYISYDSYGGSTSVLFDNGIGFNSSIDIKYGVFLNKSKTIALYINETIGYCRFSNDYTEIYDYYGYTDTYYGRFYADLLFFNEKIGFSVFW